MARSVVGEALGNSAGALPSTTPSSSTPTDTRILPPSMVVENVHDSSSISRDSHMSRDTNPPRLRQVWCAGITTVPKRRGDLFLKTLNSLRHAGFTNPRVFVDGENESGAIHYRNLGLEVTTRYPTIRTFGNWLLSAMELYIRNPTATRYAVFQDDFITYSNLIYYLDWCTYPENPPGYWNLYTFPSNQKLAPRTEHGGTKEGWYLSNQFGRGAVALVFSRDVLVTLFQQKHMIERPMDAHRGHRAVDGGIVTALNKVGIKEYVHSPSLVQHTGLKSSMGNLTHPLAESFRGESFDALDLISQVEACKK